MKDLKKEYEELILTEIPDLWDRIEAALPADEEIPAPIEPKKINSVQQIKTASVETTTKSNVKPFNKAKLYRWSSVAAACLCACIVIPIALKDAHGCGSTSEAPASFDSAPAAVEEIPIEEYEMAAKEGAEDSMNDGFSYNDVMEEAAAEEVISSGNSSSNSVNDWGENTLNIWDAEVSNPAPSKGTSFEPEETESVFEVIAIIESETMTDGDITGYSLLITDDFSEELNTDHMIGYFSEELANRLDEYDIDLKKEYIVHLRLNEEKQYYEIIEIE